MNLANWRHSGTIYDGHADSLFYFRWVVTTINEPINIVLEEN